MDKKNRPAAEAIGAYKKARTIALLSLSAPVLAWAQESRVTLGDILEGFREFLRLLLPLAVGASLMVFVWGMALFVLRSENEEEQKKGRQIMVWGVVVLFLSVALWGVVEIFMVTFGLQPGEPCPPPQIINGEISTC